MCLCVLSVCENLFHVRLEWTKLGYWYDVHVGSASFFVNHYNCLESRRVHNQAGPCLSLLPLGLTTVSFSVQLDVSSCPLRGTQQMFNSTARNWECLRTLTEAKGTAKVSQLGQDGLAKQEPQASEASRLPSCSLPVSALYPWVGPSAGLWLPGGGGEHGALS